MVKRKSILSRVFVSRKGILGGLPVLLVLLLLLYPRTLSAQWYYDEIGSLRGLNARLSEKVDSLERELRHIRSSVVYDTWDSLTGLDFAMSAGSDGFATLTPSSPDGSTLSDSELILEAKLQFASGSVAIPYRPVIMKYVDLWGVTKKRSMPAVMERYRKNYALFRAAFEKEGVPEEIIPLCIVESAVSPKARSAAGAVGVWQLMPETARGYGLTVDEERDDRTDIVKSTAVAAKYLARAYKKFGRWDLAVLSYNCGSGRIQKSIIKSGGSTEFWDVWEYLPSETQGYLLSLVALNYVMKYPEEV